MKKFKIAVVQQQASSNPKLALEQISQAVDKAANKGADLILLQELHNAFYFCQTEDPKQFDYAEPIPGPSTTYLAALAKKHNVVIVASLFEKRSTAIYHNTAIVFERDGTIAGKYRKMHIPDDPGYYEKYYFTPGDLGFIPINTSVAKLGVLLCWDQWFPEAARLMALAGADILLYPTAIGWDLADSSQQQQRQTDAWVTVQRGHAIANGIPLAVCNRVGFEEPPNQTDNRQAANRQNGIQFWGSSFIAGPQGELLAQASSDEADILITEIDTKRSETIRRIWPFFRDRRIDAYQGLLERFLDDSKP